MSPITITESELQAMLQKNPSLRVRDIIGPSRTAKSKLETLEPDKAAYAKYRNRKVFVFADGFVSFEKDVPGHGEIVAKYDSAREFKRHGELKLLEKAKKIHGLRWQYRLPLQPAFVRDGKQIRAIDYVADFFYYEAGSHNPTIEDVKGLDPNTDKHILTKDFRLKWKMAMYRYPEIKFVIC